MRDEDVVVLKVPQLSASERLYMPQIIAGIKCTLRHTFDLKLRGKTVQEYPEKTRFDSGCRASGQLPRCSPPES